MLDDAGDHLVDGFPHALTVQNLAALPVDDLALLVHDLVVIQQVLTDSEVVGLDLLLCVLHGLGKGLVGNLLSLRNTQCLEHRDHALGSEQTHQIVLQRNIESRFAGIALTAGTAAQLVVNSSGLVPFCADDLQAARFLCRLVQLDVRAAACHVRCNGHRAVLTGLGNNLCLQLVILRIEDVVRNAFLAQHPGYQLRGLNGNGAHEDRLALFVCFLDGFHNGCELLALGLEYRIVSIDTCHRTVGRNHDDIHSVDLAELLLLGLCRTGHAALFVKLIKEVLERDGRQRLGFALDLYVLLRLNGLMQAVRIPSSRHHASGELVDDHNLIVLDDVIMIARHQVVGTQCQDDAMLDLQVLRIRQVLQMEELLRLLNAGGREIDDLILLIDNEVAGLLLLNAHNGIDLGEILHVLAPCHLLGKDVAGLVYFR